MSTGDWYLNTDASNIHIGGNQIPTGDIQNKRMNTLNKQHKVNTWTSSEIKIEDPSFWTKTAADSRNPNIWDIPVGTLVYLRTRCKGQVDMFSSEYSFGSLFHEEDMVAFEPVSRLGTWGNPPLGTTTGISLGGTAQTSISSPGCSLGPICGTGSLSLPGTTTSTTWTHPHHIPYGGNYNVQSTGMNPQGSLPPGPGQKAVQNEQGDEQAPESVVAGFRKPTDYQANQVVILEQHETYEVEDYKSRVEASKKAYRKTSTEQEELSAYYQIDGIPFKGVVIDKFVPPVYRTALGETIEAPVDYPVMYKVLLNTDPDNPQSLEELWFIDHVLEPVDKENPELSQKS